MISKYAGKCAVCKGQIAIGDEISWKKGRGAWHATCNETITVFKAGPKIEIPMQGLAGLFLNYKPMCIAPIGQLHEQHGVRCGQDLGAEEKNFCNLPGRQCKTGHWSIHCDKCGVTSFPIGSVPTGQHETWFSTYACRACGFKLFSEEGADPLWGEFKR